MGKDQDPENKFDPFQTFEHAIKNVYESKDEDQKNKSEETKTKYDEEKPKQDEIHSKVLDKIIKSENSHFKIYSPILVAIIILLSLIKGSKSMNSIAGIISCSPLDYTVFAIQILFLLLSTIFSVYIVSHEYKVKLGWGYEFTDGDLSWTPKLIVKFSIFAVATGFIASVFGIGGGVIINPLLLSFKVPAVVSSSTGMYMIMFSSLSSSILYTFAGNLNIGYAFFLGAYVVVGAAIGIKLINDLIKKTGKASYIAFVLVIVIIISAIVMPVYGVINLIDNINKGKDIMQFGAFW